MAVAGLQQASELESYLGDEERSSTQTSSIRKMWQDLENECRVRKNERGKMNGAILGSESPCSSSLGGESMESEDTLTDANGIENEHPQIENQMVLQEKAFHEWGSKSFSGHTFYGPSRGQRVGENECKRVRIVREWIESSTQQGDNCRTAGLEESTTLIGSQIDGAHRSIRRIYGRQALLDLLTKFVRERKREVDDLMENKSVSNFPHRHRIQSLLKGRFLRNQRFVEDEKQTSFAASELGLLRQTHAVSDIRKGFLSRLNNYTEETVHDFQQKISSTDLTSHWESYNPSVEEMQLHDDNILQDEERDELPITVDYSPQSDSDTSSNSDITYVHTQQGAIDTSSDNEMKFDCIAEEFVCETPNGSHSPQESHDHDDDDDDVSGWYHEEEWYDNYNDDGDGSRAVELRQLTNRRSVSSLLQSDFGARLDRLMQSYVNRQYHGDHDFDHHLPTEREIIIGLRSDIETLEQRMNDMQTMLEACMYMQAVLQQSVQQEVYSALNRSPNSQEAFEDCFLCCDDQLESLPERFERVLHICSKCTQKVDWSNLKESVRQP